MYTDLKEFSMEHPRKLRTFADEISPVGVSAAFFSMSVSSQKLSTAPWHEMNPRDRFNDTTSWCESKLLPLMI